MQPSSRCWILCFVCLLSLCVGIQSEAILGTTSRAAAVVWRPPSAEKRASARTDEAQQVLNIPRGGWSIIPSGYNPLGYKITALGKQFLSFEGSLDSEVGRFLASLKAHRKRRKAIKEMWLEIVRSSKQGISMRIYRELDRILDFCLKAGLID